MNVRQNIQGDSVVFAGTPEFGAAILEGLLDYGCDVRLVLTQPDRKAGRGQKEKFGAVKKTAMRFSLPVYQPDNLNDPSCIDVLNSVNAPILVVAAYGLIIPEGVLLSFNKSINVHASLLPRWRGAAPIQRALMEGDSETGISIMEMQKGLDTGPVYLQRSVSIDKDDTAGSLQDKLQKVGSSLLANVLKSICQNSLQPKPQDTVGVTYAKKIDKAQTRIDWSNKVIAIERLVRALCPNMGAFTTIDQTVLKIWDLEKHSGTIKEAGTILEVDRNKFIVACGDGTVNLKTIQKAGSRKMEAREFLLGNSIEVGQKFS